MRIEFTRSVSLNLNKYDAMERPEYVALWRWTTFISKSRFLLFIFEVLLLVVWLVRKWGRKRIRNEDERLKYPELSITREFVFTDGRVYPLHINHIFVHKKESAQRLRQRERERERKCVCISVCVKIYGESQGDLNNLQLKQISHTHMYIVDKRVGNIITGKPFPYLQSFSRYLLFIVKKPHIWTCLSRVCEEGSTRCVKAL